MIVQRQIRRREPTSGEDSLPLDLHPVIRRVLLARGVTRKTDLDLALARLHSPNTLSGIDVAAGLLAEEVRAYLEENEEIGLSKLVNVMKNQRNSEAMTFGAIGWLARDGKIAISKDGKKIYMACDTGLFGDMRLIGDEGIDLAVLPIGDNYTMGPDDALRAVEFLRPKHVIPVHYSTFELIKQDPNAWAERVRSETDAEVHVLKPGESITLD